ncbi:MAG: alkaline phosphatase [Alphaproteobacteria bacterium]|nr:MAG: alkaline phosphatase [Alphaproteobacteria bacterium]
MISRFNLWGALALLVVVVVGGYTLYEPSAGQPIVNVVRPPAVSEGSAVNWWDNGQQALANRLAVRHRNTKAKNVILFIGDGMGVSTVTAARIYDGQSRGEQGEEGYLSFESFPHLALIKTYTNNLQVAQSSATATAMNTGIKTTAGVLGIAPEALRGNCEAALAHSVITLAERAEARGMSTGIVSTANLTHATPAAVYAHSAERIWESDLMMPSEAKDSGCKDIARQFAEFDVGDGIDIALGGGRRHFYGLARGGMRLNPLDDLVSEWQANGPNRIYVETKEELDDLAGDQQSQILGLFSTSHMTFSFDRDAESTEPSLADMTKAAINRLSVDPDGYYLMVEAGRIDHGHHQGQAEYALSETQALSQAVQVALDMVDLDETLILVTADHSHTLTIGGYPMRGNPILGNVRENDMSGLPMEEVAVGMDGKTYSTLGYFNGPGAVGGERTDAAPRYDEKGKPAVQQAAVPAYMDLGPLGKRVAETHAGEDVALYAIGPQAHIVGGVLEQHVIFHIMTYALGWGNLSLAPSDNMETSKEE